MRPCEEKKPCKYLVFDYQENCRCCAIDFDGTDCPYIKPYGRKKYEDEHLNCESDFKLRRKEKTE